MSNKRPIMNKKEINEKKSIKNEENIVKKYLYFYPIKYIVYFIKKY